jgi:ankyrin repeat protein
VVKLLLNDSRIDLTAVQTTTMRSNIKRMIDAARGYDIPPTGGLSFGFGSASPGSFSFGSAKAAKNAANKAAKNAANKAAKNAANKAAKNAANKAAKNAADRRAAAAAAKAAARTRLFSANVNSNAVNDALNAGVDLDDRDEAGRTALGRAAERGRLAAVKRLLERGADPNGRDKIKRGAGDGFTPLHWAAKEDRRSVLKALLDGGADPNKTSKDGRTPLHVGVAECNEDAVKTLLKDGRTKVDKTDCEGETALYLAVKKNHIDMVTILLRAGASPTKVVHDIPVWEHARAGNVRNAVAPDTSSRRSANEDNARRARGDTRRSTPYAPGATGSTRRSPKGSPGTPPPSTRRSSGSSRPARNSRLDDVDRLAAYNGLTSAKRPSAWAILGIDTRATKAEAKKAYLALARRVHPDKHPGHVTEATKAARVLNEAWKTVEKSFR